MAATPRFHVYQHQRYRAVLEELVNAMDEIIVGSSETARQAPLGVVPEW
jgi:hypothetical protein